MERSIEKSGFTVIEMIAVLLIVGVLAAVSVTRMIDVGASVAGETDRLAANLRFAQYMAMTNNTASWSVSLSPSGYTLMQNGSSASVNFPDDDSPTHSFPNGVSITTGTGSVTFDEWGSPGTANRVITLSGSHRITVTKNTGFIQ